MACNKVSTLIFSHSSSLKGGSTLGRAVSFFVYHGNVGGRVSIGIDLKPSETRQTSTDGSP